MAVACSSASRLFGAVQSPVLARQRAADRAHCPLRVLELSRVALGSLCPPPSTLLVLCALDTGLLTSLGGVVTLCDLDGACALCLALASARVRAQPRWRAHTATPPLSEAVLGTFLILRPCFLDKVGCAGQELFCDSCVQTTVIGRVRAQYRRTV